MAYFFVKVCLAVPISVYKQILIETHASVINLKCAHSFVDVAMCAGRRFYQYNEDDFRV